MVEISNEIRDKISKYIQKLQKSNFKINEVYLFGSYSQGKENEISDIDLAIISPEFDGNRLLDREKLLAMNRDIDIRISVLPLSVEARENSFFFEQEILKKGIKVF